LFYFICAILYLETNRRCRLKSESLALRAVEKIYETDNRRWFHTTDTNFLRNFSFERMFWILWALHTYICY